mmetsp:Transcript_40782/g.87567  ORF Transcript_40782/g.87567 Transcript_40782/m.87567 type:complete len:305 (+) Transcript_40782:3072-3986(+)
MATIDSRNKNTKHLLHWQSRPLEHHLAALLQDRDMRPVRMTSVTFRPAATQVCHDFVVLRVVVMMSLCGLDVDIAIPVDLSKLEQATGSWLVVSVRVRILGRHIRGPVLLRCIRGPLLVRCLLVGLCLLSGVGTRAVVASCFEAPFLGSSRLQPEVCWDAVSQHRRHAAHSVHFAICFCFDFKTANDPAVALFLVCKLVVIFVRLVWFLVRRSVALAVGCIAVVAGATATATVASAATIAAVAASAWVIGARYIRPESRAVAAGNFRTHQIIFEVLLSLLFCLPFRLLVADFCEHPLHCPRPLP